MYAVSCEGSAAVAPIAYAVPCEEGSAAPALPPMPTPDYKARRQQSTCGIAVVLGNILFFLGVTNAAVWPDGFDASSRWICLWLIYGEAIVALVCLAGLLFGDPGVVRRTKDTTMPLPAEVAERLCKGGMQHQFVLTNIQDGPRSYCVRCFVWRDPAKGTRNPMRFLRCWVRRPQACGASNARRAGWGRARHLLPASAAVQAAAGAGAPLLNLPAVRPRFRSPLRRLWPVHRRPRPLGQHVLLRDHHTDGLRGLPDHDCRGRVVGDRSLDDRRRGRAPPAQLHGAVARRPGAMRSGYGARRDLIVAHRVLIPTVLG